MKNVIFDVDDTLYDLMEAFDKVHKEFFMWVANDYSVGLHQIVDYIESVRDTHKANLQLLKELKDYINE